MVRPRIALKDRLKLNNFGVHETVGTSQPRARLVSTRKGLTRKPIDQLEYLEDLDALAVLSGQLASTLATRCKRSCQLLLNRSNGYSVRPPQPENTDTPDASEICSVHLDTDDMGPTTTPRTVGKEVFDRKVAQGGQYRPFTARGSEF